MKMDLREIGWGGMDRIELVQDRDWWRALVNTIMNHWVWSLSPGRGKIFSLHIVQTGSGAHPTSYPVWIRGSFPGIK
jgi:hypothetical protein